MNPVSTSDASTTEPAPVPAGAVDDFIRSWHGKDGGERANYQLFIFEICELLGLPTPRPASSDPTENAYVFERRLDMPGPSDATSSGYIDCYKRGCFILETKQGVEKKSRETLSDAGREREARRRRGHGVRGSRAWDESLVKARHQAERYARALPATEGRPPFLIIADVGHCIELYAEFTRTGGVYTPFPSARTHRILLDDLRQPDIQQRLRQAWTDPAALDPARRTAAVTRGVAAKLAALAKSLETAGHNPQLAASFLMRCIFTMFAEDVELLPKGGFSELLKSLRGQTQVAPIMLESLWKAMDQGEFFPVIWFRKKLLRFNGGLFREPRALAINDDQLELLIEAARSDWRNVEPAIFGALLERALDPRERHKLGAHYTPRAYVERLVLPTVVEPLRADWQAVQAAAAQCAAEGNEKKALREIESFHRRLCDTRVLDPACGTGNFLYVTLEHLKRLEGEVLDTLEAFGGSRQLEMDTVTVRPGQMLGIEINPRAAVITELVLWIGYLQWHIHTRGDARAVSEPVLEDAGNIETRDAILTCDRREFVLDERGRPKTIWNGRATKPHPVTGRPIPDESVRTPIHEYVNPRPAPWPKCDFIVGNPPFIGASRMREALGDGYVDALRNTIGAVPESADFVMYWWQQAAERAAKGEVRRFGFVTTNSIRQTFNRRVLEKQMNGKPPLSLVFAIPDHPWVDDVEAAAVRVAMTVGETGNASGLLLSVESEEPGDESYKVSFAERVGKILPNLSIGPDAASAVSLRANSDISNHGVIRGGEGFLISHEKAIELGLESVSGAEKHLRPIVNGKDLTQRSRGAYVIDFFGLSEREVQEGFPEIYQHLLTHVKPIRAQSKRATRRENWWLFNESVPKLRRMLAGLTRFVSTSETAKHRIFTFVDKSVLPEHKLVNIALDDAYHLGVLSSRIHVAWAMANRSNLGVGNDPVYVKTRCFETFPFPDCADGQEARIRELGEALDAHRKARQATHPGLTMTGLYNVLEKLRSGEPLTAKEKTVHEQGLVSVLRQLHDDLDAAVAEAYGWPVDLSEEEILFRLVALNHARAAEEARGRIRWLRPGYQASDPAAGVETQLDIAPARAASGKPTPGEKPAWPKTLPDQIAAIRSALAAVEVPSGADALVKHFCGARRERVEAILESLQALGHAREVEEGRYTA